VASETTPLPGTIGWIDLPHANAVRDFYSDVTGWAPVTVGMGDYRDSCMNAANGQSVAGICHARGDNASLRPVWIVYIVVANPDTALQRCEARNGKVLGTPRSFGGDSRFCVIHSMIHSVIQDPSGAIAALYESRSQAE
jgi:uncharacterized protein